MQHVSVLLHEVLHWLAPRPGGTYLDGTLGLAGHSAALLEQLDGNARLLGLDRDPQALAAASQRLSVFRYAAVCRQARYSEFSEILAELGWQGLDGALLDLGVSSLQLDTPERGFSFLADGPLDMRMGAGGPDAPATRLVNKAGVEELQRIIATYGEEPQAGRIARAIVQARALAPIETTGQLAALVERTYPAAWRATARNHPATRTFQALRMAVNSELEELETFLRLIPQALKPGGRVAIISFHSLEDRIVKHAFRHESLACTCPREVPQCVCGGPRLRVLTKKPVRPTEQEMAANSRARSAKLRVAERLGSGRARAPREDGKAERGARYGRRSGCSR